MGRSRVKAGEAPRLHVPEGEAAAAGRVLGLKVLGCRGWFMVWDRKDDRPPHAKAVPLGPDLWAAVMMDWQLNSTMTPSGVEQDWRRDPDANVQTVL